MSAREADRWLVRWALIGACLVVGFAIAWGAAPDEVRGIVLLAGALLWVTGLVALYIARRRHLT